MNPEMQALIISLVVKVGFNAAIALLENLKNAKTIDDAIAALKTSAGKSWEDYKAQA